MDSFVSGREPMLRSYGHSNKLSGSIKAEKLLSELIASGEGVFTMQLVNCPVYETEINGRGDPLRRPHTLYPKKLALNSPKSGGRSVGIVRLRTKGHGVFQLVNCMRMMQTMALTWEEHVMLISFNIYVRTSDVSFLLRATNMGHLSCPPNTVYALC
jgi:hypothetical protein